MEKIPLVSVIIPMYNAAKFISQTLESLLYQTMKDFEVVVIDDCSTDNSIEVVESFEPRFDSVGVKLHVVKLQNNTGTPGLPRNVGINFARGKYISFLDSDDLLTPTALEELTSLAEISQAEVVHTDTFLLLSEKTSLSDEAYFKIKSLKEIFTSADLTVCQNQRLPLVPEPIFETKDIAQRIRAWVNRGYNWEPYTSFCGRDFILGNQIQFPKMRSYGDMLFSFSVLCSAEKLLRVPNLVYVYRKRLGSVSYENYSDVAARFHKWIRVLNDGFNAFEEIMAGIPFFENNPDYRYAVLDFSLNDVLHSTYPLYVDNQPFAVNDFIKKEFHSDDAALAAHLFNTVNIYRLQIMQLQQENIQLKKILEQK